MRGDKSGQGKRRGAGGCNLPMGVEIVGECGERKEKEIQEGKSRGYI
jgi:hypothetical protein